MKKIKLAIFHLLEKGAHGNRINRWVEYAITLLIVLSVISIILESITEVNQTFGWFLHRFDIFVILVFTLEYLLRLFISDLTHPSSNKFKSALKFIFSVYGLVDLLAVLPFYLPMLIKLDLKFLRILRLTRFLRILKINRYNKSVNLIWAVIKEKKTELAATGFITFLTLLISSFLMYYIESEHQPDQFPNIIATFWWAVATLTTVGYGDIYPVTGLGKLISGLIAILGIGLVALPTGLISAGFIAKIESKKSKDNEKKCPHCGEYLPNEANE